MGGIIMKHKFYYLLHYFLVFLFLLNSICSSNCRTAAATKKTPVFIILTKYSKTLDIRNEFYIGAIVSNGKTPTWKSSNSRVASVNTYGLVTAKKGGQAKITAKVPGAEARCIVTINKTKIQLSSSSLSLEHGEFCQLRATTSNRSHPQFKSKKPSVASVTDSGKVCGEKPGSTYITITADGTKTTCRVTVKKPLIKLSHTKITLSPDTEKTLQASTSSGLPPQWKSNKSSVATVDDNGTVYAVKPGTARIRVKLDGVTKYCTVKVTK